LELLNRVEESSVHARRVRYKGSDSLSPQLACRRRVHRRCLASRHDAVLNVMAACLASSREAL
jgi:hypothetical protein